MNKRRELIIALGAGVLAAPLLSFAQQRGCQAPRPKESRRESPLSRHATGSYGSTAAAHDRQLPGNPRPTCIGPGSAKSSRRESDVDRA